MRWISGWRSDRPISPDKGTPNGGARRRAGQQRVTQVADQVHRRRTGIDQSGQRPIRRRVQPGGQPTLDLRALGRLHLLRAFPAEIVDCATPNSSAACVCLIRFNRRQRQRGEPSRTGLRSRTVMAARGCRVGASAGQRTSAAASPCVCPARNRPCRPPCLPAPDAGWRRRKRPARPPRQSKAPISTNSTPSVANCKAGTVLRTHELRQEGQEEQRRLGVQHLGQDRLPECRARVDARAGARSGRSARSRDAHAQVDQIGRAGV